MTVHPWRRLWPAALATGGLLLASALGASPGPPHAAAAAPTCTAAATAPPSETIVVPFKLGTAGVSTNGCYQGHVVVTVSGTGQAAGTQYSDAFYVFTDNHGVPITPIHYAPPKYYDTWELWINGGPSDYYVQPIPAFKNDHVYSFAMKAPGGPLTFAVGDTKTNDNTGFYTVTVRQL